jgi:cysteine synthase B
MLEDAESSDELTHDKVILDSTSGNTGIAYAWIGAIKGYKVELVMPLNVSEERKKIVRAFGAKITFSDPLEGSDGAILEARKLLKENPEKYFKPDQYNNPANSKAHYLSTGREVFEQTNGRVTHFIATIGTGGTIMGAGKRLKEFNSEIQVIAAEPEHPLHGIEGLKHMASSIVPGIYHENQLDGKIPIPTEEAYDVAKRLALEEGLFVGQSSGAAMWGALKLSKDLSDGIIVTVFPDGGDKYLSTALWD